MDIEEIVKRLEDGLIVRTAFNSSILRLLNHTRNGWKI